MDASALQIIQPPRIPIKAVETRPDRSKLFSRKLWRYIFYLHLFLIFVLTAVLTTRGFLLLSPRNRRFSPRNFLLPLFSAAIFSAILSFLWPLLTQHSPSKAMKTAFWLSPLLTCAVGILLVYNQSAAAIGPAIFAIVFAISISLYTCWVSQRFNHSVRVISVSTAFPPKRTSALTGAMIVVATFYSAFIVIGIGGATSGGTVVEKVLIFVLILSMKWTMHVIKNTITVVVSRIRYENFAGGEDLDTGMVFKEVVDQSLSGVFIGSAVLPILGVFRGFARGVDLASGETDEFMFSCTSCFSGLASRVITIGNRWGFVYVGVYDKGFVQASTDTWELFRRVRLESVINSDLTSSFCFLCGVAGGAASSLVAGIWSLVGHNKGHVTEESIYAFLIGYFICRIGMAWPQACVLAYHVAYAENPDSHRFDSTIPDRIQELHRQQVQSSQRTQSVESIEF
ncbi:protein PNS1-like [Impatiens glandulifera]|uniref:protein PNS1-like n=1 Tax=Impatiens glandulifera TaxID=253017 RepID=UPI001FB14587|nr:protein PNS1-like [Impatiens glandulifera]